jgi:hypothetical protein
MMELIEIRSLPQAAEALNGKPIDWTMVILSRLALRTLPTMAGTDDSWLKFYAVSLFRANLFAWASLHDGPSLFSGATEPSHDSLQEALRRNYHSSLPWPAIASAQSALLSLDSFNFAGLFAWNDLPSSNSDEQYDAIGRMVFGPSSIESDFDWLTKNQHPGNTRDMTSLILWLNKMPEEWRRSSAAFRTQLLTVDPSYSVWIDWYERRVRGEEAAFDIPGDKYRKEDKKILRRLAEATDEDFWGKGHEYVNATLKTWLDEARGRTAIVGLAHRILDAKEALEQQASPQAKTVDGKLDAGPNSVFDKPQYGNHLADLPSELLAYTEVILKSLPSNCQPVVRNCFTGFRDEMLVRGNRPILNIVKAMAASLTAELYGAPDPSASPDDWQLKDPREWGAGMDSMFASFFKSYHDLIHHFPMDAEREEFIANTPIDEVAASGAALTQPVDAVAELIKNLGKQGFATENIVRIIEAHQLYNRDVSQLPAPDQPTDAITPKRRHVLGTAGFYLQTYSVIGSSASIYSLPAFQELLPKLKDAIDALLGFIA